MPEEIEVDTDKLREKIDEEIAATSIRARASDEWACYQAKGIKGAVTLGSEATWRAVGETPPPSLDSTAQRYASEQKVISDTAKALEHQRDEEVAPLTRSKGVPGTSLAVRVVGAALFVSKLFA